MSSHRRAHAPRGSARTVPRKEDPTLRARVVASTSTTCGCPGMLHAAVLRSPHAHARIASIDTRGARRRCPACIAVLTGAGAAELIEPAARLLRRAGRRSTRSRSRRCATPARPSAVVAAESRYIAEDALALIEVEYEPLPAVADPARRWPRAPRSCTRPSAATSSTSTRSLRRRRRRLRRGRPRGPPRAALAPRHAPSRWRPRARSRRFDPRHGRMDVWSNTNLLNFGAWVCRPTRCGVAEQPAQLHPAARWAAASARKHLLAKADRHRGGAGQGHRAAREVHGGPRRQPRGQRHAGPGPALRRRARPRRRRHVPQPAHRGRRRLRRLLPCSATRATRQRAGPDRRARTGSAASTTTSRAVLTNKDQQGVFRGAGSDVDQLHARAPGRRRRATSSASTASRSAGGTSSSPTQFPYKIPTGNIYDSGDYAAVLDRALELADLDRWRAEQERARAEGRYIGIGLASAPAAQRLRRRPSSGSSTTAAAPASDARERAAARRPDRRVHRDAVLRRSGATARRRSSRRSSPRSSASTPPTSRHLRRDSPHGLPSAGPGGSRMTVMLSGAVARRRAQDARTRCRDRGAPAGGRPTDIELRRRRVRRAARRARRCRSPTSGCKAYWFKLDLPGGHGERAGGAAHLRPSVSRRCRPPTARTWARSIR